jgi:hypothetical protein
MSLSDEKMIKIQIVDLDEMHNFGVHDFFDWNLLLQNVA